MFLYPCIKLINPNKKADKMIMIDNTILFFIAIRQIPYPSIFLTVLFTPNTSSTSDIINKATKGKNVSIVV